MSNIGSSVKSLNPSTVPSKQCLDSSVPDILKPNCRSFQETQGVETSLLDPVVSRKDYIRFTLDKKGILHSNSKIKFSLKKVSGTEGTNDGFLPASVGAKAFISKCVLRCGNQILDQTENFNFLSSYKNLFIDNEQVLRKESIKSGIMNAYRPIKMPVMTGVGVANGEEHFSEMTYDTGKEFSLDFTASTGTSTRADNKVETTLPDTANPYNLTDYVIDLHEMFNSLRFTQIPLYMCEQPVVIELFMETDSTKTLCKNDYPPPVAPAVPPVSPVFELDVDSPVLIADYIYYDSETMAEFQNKNQMLQLPFRENKLITTTVNYNSNPNFVRNLGGAQKQINTITILHTNTQANVEKSLYNRYYSELPADSYDINVKINDRFLYPISLENPSEIYSTTFRSEGLPMNITGRDFKDNLGVDFTEYNLLNKYDQDSEVEGLKHFICLRNITGERISNRGIELNINATNGADSDIQQLVYLEMSKTLVLKNGRWSEVYV